MIKEATCVILVFFDSRMIKLKDDEFPKCTKIGGDLDPFKKYADSVENNNSNLYL